MNARVAVIRGKRYSLNPLDPNQLIAIGGEAEIFRVGNWALKWFKSPDYPGFVGDPDESALAARRIAEHQRKLPALHAICSGLSGVNAVLPIDLAYTTSNKVGGYVMQFLSNCVKLRQLKTPALRKKVANEVVVTLFRKIHAGYGILHAAGIVQGDANELNFMIDLGSETPWFIDMDSAQFGAYPCRVFTKNYVDPRICDASKLFPEQKRPHDENSDWYAFDTLLFQTLLMMHPLIGGKHIPHKKGSLAIGRDERIMRGISVYHPEVTMADLVQEGLVVHWKTLPDDINHRFAEVFAHRLRGEFPVKLLEEIVWKRCSACGLTHARNVCPDCLTASPASIKAQIIIHGSVTVQRVFKTSGDIVAFAMKGGKPLYGCAENGKLFREGGRVVGSFPANVLERYGIAGDATLFVERNLLIVNVQGAASRTHVIDSFRGTPVFAANGSDYVWSEGGTLMRYGRFGPEPIGKVLAGGSQIWLGEKFGFGFYQAGSLFQPFFFDAFGQSGVFDQIVFPPLKSDLLDASCVFGGDCVWFMRTVKDGSRILNKVAVISKAGGIIATHEEEEGNDSWLGSIRGKFAVADFLLAATSRGIVKMECVTGKISETKSWPDTASYVSSDCTLAGGEFGGRKGLFVASRRTIVHVSM